MFPVLMLQALLFRIYGRLRIELTVFTGGEPRVSKSILRPKSSMSSIHRQYTSWLSPENEPANRCNGPVYCCY